MKHYLAVLVPAGDGAWRAHIPDFPGCSAEGRTVEAVIDASIAAAVEHADQLRQQGVSVPAPRSYEDVCYHSNGWGADRGIDWSKAVISWVRIPATD